MQLARRYVVLAMCFTGFLITIGSREAFSMVIVHVINPHNDTDKDCPTHAANSSRDLHHPKWPQTDVFNFQLAYFVGNIIMQFPGGLLATKWKPRRVCALCVCLTGLLFIGARFAVWKYRYAVYAIRLIQGLIEGPVVPSINGMVAAWAPPSAKSRYITIVYAGAYLSNAISATIAGFFICHVSWGAVMFLYGGLAVIWSMMLLCCVYDSPKSCQSKLSRDELAIFKLDKSKDLESPVSVSTQHKRSALKHIPWCRILRSLPVSAVLVAAFCRNYIFTLLVVMIPKYYKDMFHLSPDKLGLWTALPHFLMMIMVVLCGQFVDVIIRKQWMSITVVRKMSETIGFGVEGGCLLAMGFVTEKYTAMALLTTGVTVSGIAISGYQVNPLDLAPQYVPVLTGIVRLGTIGSVISLVIADKILYSKDTTVTTIDSWHKVFIIAGGLHLGGVLYYLLFASGKRQPWDAEESTPTSSTTPPVNVARNVVIGYDSSGESRGLLSSGYDSSDDESESLFTKSLKVEKFQDTSEEIDEAPSWYLNTI